MPVIAGGKNSITSYHADPAKAGRRGPALAAPRVARTARYKGRASRKAIEREFPHVVVYIAGPVVSFRLVPMSFQGSLNYFRSLRLLGALITLSLGATSIVPAAPLTACANDRKKLCGTFIGSPSEMQKCMIAHRAEWSPNCAAAASGRGTAGVGSRRAKCAEHVQSKYLPQNGGTASDHRFAAPEELRRCMHGEPVH